MDHQLVGVLFLSLSHLYLFLLFLNLWLLSDVCLSVCQYFCLSVYQSVEVCLAIQFSFYLSIHLTICPSICLSIYLSFLPFWPLVCLTVCLWVRLSNLSFCPLINFGLFEIKIQDQGHFLYAFLKSFHVKKNIKIGKRKLRHKMIKQEIVLI